jgi:hypothetical protein
VRKRGGKRVEGEQGMWKTEEGIVIGWLGRGGSLTFKPYSWTVFCALCVVFKPVEGDVAPPKSAQSDVLVREDRWSMKLQGVRGRGQES